MFRGWQTPPSAPEMASEQSVTLAEARDQLSLKRRKSMNQGPVLETRQPTK